MQRLLHRVPRLRTLLRSRAVLWRLPGIRDGIGLRSAILSWSRILVRQRVLRLETRSLGLEERPETLDPRPLRRAQILIAQRFGATATDRQTIGGANPQRANRKRTAVARQPNP